MAAQLDVCSVGNADDRRHCVDPMSMATTDWPGTMRNLHDGRCAGAMRSSTRLADSTAMLRKSQIVHFARVLVIDNRYLQVITEYDGSHTDYTEFFRTALPDVFGMLFSLAENAAPPEMGDRSTPGAVAKGAIRTAQGEVLLTSLPQFIKVHGTLLLLLPEMKGLSQIAQQPS